MQSNKSVVEKFLSKQNKRRNNKKQNKGKLYTQPAQIMEKKKMRFKYIENVTISSVSALAGIYQFQTSAYDPNFTATGKQPFYWD